MFKEKVVNFTSSKGNSKFVVKVSINEGNLTLALLCHVNHVMCHCQKFLLIN